MRWAIRGIGLLSTIILARLLAPDDFGVVAMAMVAVALLQSFSQSGVDLALLGPEVTEADIREQVAADRRSLAFTLRFRAPDRTLTSEEANVARDAAVAVAFLQGVVDPAK